MTEPLAIIGGGASGLAAAVFCARQSGGAGITVYERASRVGKKLLATGNGTCNITNTGAAPNRYHGNGAAAFVSSVLSAFPPTEALRFFDSLGIPCIPREEGRQYPLCGQAAAVLDALRLELKRLGVQERCNTDITEIRPTGGGFTLCSAAGESFAARRVLLCAGGAASPSLGGSTAGYMLATALGHTRTPLFPSIVQVRADSPYLKAMKGLRADATVTFHSGGTAISHTGEILFTEYGLSGPAVMQISRAVGDWERRRQGTMTATLNFLPQVTETEVRRLLCQRQALGRTAEDYLTGLFAKRIGQTLCRAAGLSLADPCTDLSEAMLDRLTETVVRFPLAVTGTQGFGGAQVTAGGIALSEVNAATMESRRQNGLYFAGEMLDVDGDCGGFNLQWAWASAYVAAKAVCAR